MAGEGRASEQTSLPRIGSYDLLQPLGSGGMSSVFRARHAESGLEVAIKILPRTLAKNPTVLQRFLREAKSAEALEHPNIVAIYDRGLDQGRHYLVLEYVPGGDLHDRVRSQGPLDIDEAVTIVRSVAKALRYADSKGLIHRDVKPANLLLAGPAQVKVADLGLALQAEAEDERVTREGTTVGTVDYMAPEQARDSRATSVRSDIYSLGCTFVFLLTGQPPYPGGDVAEKLNRHINAPPIDVRERRPEVSPALARLISRMLAKKPEARFGSYDELIAAIDALGQDPDNAVETAPADGQHLGALPTLTALIDEDDDDAIELEPIEPEPAPKAAAPPTKGQGAPTASRPGGPRVGATSAPPAKLLTFDGDERAALPAPKRGKPPAAADRSRPAPADDLLPDLVPLDDEQDLEPIDAPIVVAPGAPRTMPAQAPATAPSGRRMSEAERSWITTCVVLGISLILLVIVVDQVFRASRVPGPEVVEGDGGTADGAGGEAIVPGVAVPEPVPASAVAPTVVVAPTSTKAAPKPSETKPARPPWVEPTDPPVEIVAEAGFAPGLEERAVPDWVKAASRVADRVVTVRRVPDPREADQRSSLRLGLEVAGATVVEIADNGSFFENDLRIPGEGRSIRARKGFRPIVQLSAPRVDSTQQSTSWLDLGDKSLTLEGLDLILDVSSLRPTQTTLFSVRGGTLILRDCTLTIVNRMTSATLRGYTVVKTAAATRPSRVALDRTYLRGAYTTAIDVSGGPAEVCLLRSVVLNGQGSLATFSAPQPTPSTPRRFGAVRCIALTWGPAFELTDTPRGARPRAVPIQALGTTFAHFQSPQGASFVAGRAEAASAADVVEWQGQDNSFAGWTSWLTSGVSRPIRVANLAMLRTTWRGSDTNSEESSRSWPQLPPSPDRVPLTALRALAPNRLAVLTRVPAPSPTLHERTVEEFARPDVPGLASVESVAANARAALQVGSTPQPGRGTQAGPGRGPAPAPPTNPNAAGLQSGRIAGFGSQSLPNSTVDGYPLGGRGTATAGSSASDVLATAAAIPGTRELEFDANAPATRGDLGRFLAESIQASDPLVRVRVTGTGEHPWTPVRLPEGVSLEILVQVGASGTPPTWVVPKGVRAEAAIEARHGSVLLVNFQLARDGGSGLKRLIRVEGGHLGLDRCRLRAPGVVETGGGGLLAFTTPGTAPLPSRPGGSTWPFDRLVDAPTFRALDCLMQTGGEVLRADVGRGLVALTQCALIAGTSAIALEPGGVARSRFHADLRLEHCTLVAPDAFVTLGAWRGTVPGPDRPWVVSSNDTAFFGQFERSENDPAAVLLRADPEGFARGVLAWQSLGDDVEVPCFVATGEATPSASRKADIRSQWMALWGEHHVRNTSGPRAPSSQPARRTIARLRLHEVEPADLAIDPDYPAGRAPDALGVDLTRLGIPPGSRAGRRRPPGP